MLGLAELRSLMKMLGFNPSQKALSTTFNAMDEDESGQLDFEEFLQLMRKVDPDQEKKTVEELGFSDDEHMAFRAAFEKVDADESGMLGLDEVQDLLKMLSIEATPKEVADIFGKLDEDGSEQL